MASHDAITMGLAHCPLCIGLGVLCALRFSAYAVMVWQWRPQLPLTSRSRLQAA